MDFLKHMYELSRQRASVLDQCRFAVSSSSQSFKEALHDMAIIAEVKYATPVEGNLGITQKPAELAAEYEAMGAAAISCLTEPQFFAGSMNYLCEIRSACSLPILMKDFIVDERQIHTGKTMGADAFLLITEMLSDEEIGRLYSYGKELGMDCLVEIHSLQGLNKAIRIGADIVGVNVRDLATLKVIPERHEEMVGELPEAAVKVAESGISSAGRLQELKDMGYDAALIGRAMVKQETRRELLGCG